MTNKTGLKTYFLIAIAIFFWSTVASAFKIGLNFFTEIELLFLSIATSVVALFLLSIIKYPGQLHVGLNLRRIITSAISGFINPFLYYLVLFKAYSLLPAQVAQPVVFIWPILLTFLAALFLKQKLTRASFIALILSFVGLAIVSTQGNIADFSIPNYEGIVFCLLGSLFWASSWIINLKDSRIAVVKLFFSFLFALLYITIYAISTDNIPSISIQSIGVPVYIGLFEMSITFFLWLRALEISGQTAKMSNLIYFVPLLSFVIIHIVLKEKIHFTSVFGLLFIISGVYIQLFYSKR